MNQDKQKYTLNLNPLLTKIKEIDETTTQIHIFINIFFKSGGFDKIINFMKWEK